MGEFLLDGLEIIVGIIVVVVIIAKRLGKIEASRPGQNRREAVPRRQGGTMHTPSGNPTEPELYSDYYGDGHADDISQDTIYAAETSRKSNQEMSDPWSPLSSENRAPQLSEVFDMIREITREVKGEVAAEPTAGAAPLDVFANRQNSGLPGPAPLQNSSGSLSGTVFCSEEQHNDMHMPRDLNSARKGKERPENRSAYPAFSPSVAPQRGLLANERLSAQDLRRAVVMSEILGKPKALQPRRR